MVAPRILVTGGMHGNERLGLRLVELLNQEPIVNVETCVANPRAVAKNIKYVESDLNRSFGELYKGSYETTRASELKKIVAQFDLVLDFHNTQTPDNNCSFVGVGCDDAIFKTIKSLGLNKCVEATYDCINKYCLNAISIEISLGDKMDDPRYWYNKIRMLTFNKDATNLAKLDIYRFKQRVTWQQQFDFALDNWKPFEPLSQKNKDQLNLNGIIVPIFIGSKLTEYYATLLTKERTI